MLFVVSFSASRWYFTLCQLTSHVEIPKLLLHGNKLISPSVMENNNNKTFKRKEAKF